MSKKTYKELGPEAWYQYGQQDVGKFKKMIISNTISSLNVISGDNNDIKNMIYSIDNIGSNVKELESRCFYGCENLRSINIPSSIVEIKNEAFKNCNKLSSFDGDNNFILPKQLDDGVFENCNFKKINLQVGQNIQNEETNQYEDEIPINQIMIGYGVFKNNTNLTDISMDNLLLGQNMFENCTSLSSVTILNKEEQKFSNISPFKGCTNLKSLRIPSNINNYLELHQKTLMGSSVLSIYVDGMTEQEVEIALGIKSRDIVTVPVDYDDIKLGSIYYFDSNQDDEFNTFLEKVVNGHIPTIFIKCNTACSLCTTFKNDVLNDSSFNEFFKQQKCIIIYMNNILFLNASDEYKIKELRINKKHEFEYENYAKQKLKCTFFPMAQIAVRQQIALENLEKVPRYRLKTNSDKIQIYKFNKSSSQWKDLEKDKQTFETYISDEFWENQTQLFNNVFLGISPVSKNGMYPVVDCYWRKSNDDTVTQNFIKLDKEQKKLFLSGKNFSFKYSRNVKDDIIEVQYDLIRENVTHGSVSGYFLSLLINDDIVIYKITCNQTGNSYKSSLKLYFDDNNIYFNTYYSADKNKISGSNKDDFIKTVEYLCNDVMKCNNIEGVQNENEMIVQKIKGDCWGVEHDCTAIDKDGNPHYYTYTPPTEL